MEGPLRFPNCGRGASPHCSLHLSIKPATLQTTRPSEALAGAHGAATHMPFPFALGIDRSRCASSDCPGITWIGSLLSATIRSVPCSLSAARFPSRPDSSPERWCDYGRSRRRNADWPNSNTYEYQDCRSPALCRRSLRSNRVARGPSRRSHRRSIAVRPARRP